jgi:hypothetical protein
MKVEAFAREGFCDVHIQRLVLRPRITRFLRQETVQVGNSHPRGLFNHPPIVEISPLFRQQQGLLFNYLGLAP